MARKVLVVEDDPVCRRIAEAVLAEEGYEVRSAARGRDAIALGEEFHPDVLVTDWILEGPLNGLDVAEALVDSDPNVRVVVMSGLSGIEHQVGHLPVRRVLSKPFRVSELLDGVRETIGAPDSGDNPLSGEIPRKC